MLKGLDFVRQVFLNIVPLRTLVLADFFFPLLLAFRIFLLKSGHTFLDEFQSLFGDLVVIDFVVVNMGVGLFEVPLVLKTVEFCLFLVLVNFLHHLFQVYCFSFPIFLHLVPHLLMKLIPLFVQKGLKIISLFVQLQNRQSSLQKLALVVRFSEISQCLSAGVIMLGSVREGPGEFS